MTSADRLRDEWRERVRTHAFDALMTLNDDGLVLGAGTVLAKRCSPAEGVSALTLDLNEERVIALLSVAHGRAIDGRVLSKIRKASQAWHEGESCLALIHLAQTGLGAISEEGGGYRLFLADKLLVSGTETRELLKACGIDAAVFDALKFNPDEPRVPAGNPDGGQWTYGDTAAELHTEGVDGGGSAERQSPPTTLHGYATVYHPSLAGQQTANGDLYDPNKLTAAVLPETIPLGSVVTVTLDSNPLRSIELFVNDHGLYRIVTNPDGSTSRIPLPGRVIDLSTAAFEALTGMHTGKVLVNVRLKSRPRR